MSEPTLEERVAALEKTVADLVRARRRPPRVKDWRRTLGMFAGDEVMKEIDRLGREYREADRRKSQS